MKINSPKKHWLSKLSTHARQSPKIIILFQLFLLKWKGESKKGFIRLDCLLFSPTVKLGYKDHNYNEPI
jgi:hypothetical protein